MSTASTAGDVHTRTGNSAEAIRRAFSDNLFYSLGRFPEVASLNDYYMALALTVRDRLLRRWVSTAHTYYEKAARSVAYLSAEFLLGPHLENNIINLGIYDEVREAVASTGLSLEDLIAQEEEPGLGNGGLGRLAACYLDSLATLEIPAIGYGIRYEFGIFDQEVRDGWQVEITDKWLRYGNPWEIPRPETCYDVPMGGHVESYYDDERNYRVRWLPDRVVKGVAYDTPILGYGVNTANMLRLWKAEAVESFDFQAFNVGDYYGAVDEKVVSENLTKVLYPNDEPVAGKQLRLAQQYFFVSCSLRDMIRICKQQHADLTRFHEKFTVQLNDTHPAIAVAELMRLLLDEHGFTWDAAWEVTNRTFAYTNHTLLPEALEKWPVSLLGSLLPRHLQIIFEINHRFLQSIRLQFPGDSERVRQLSIIEEGAERYVRMAHLACVGSYGINGVARLHTELLKANVLRGFHELWPAKFSNKTNGVTPRRFVALSNPPLATLLTERLGDGWLRDLGRLRDLEPLADDPGFQDSWRGVKRKAKERLAAIIRARTGVTVDPTSMFDVQVKRIHEYKRQHLNVLHVITRYRYLKENPNAEVAPRTFVFGGKAAPGYDMAKRMIRLVTAVGEVVNNDPAVSDRMKVVFLPDFNVTNAQPVYPAADLSEQISLAGKEASGTGNMKFALNGALTIGTLDGANVEIREAVGAENFFLFGLTVDEVQRLRPGYRARDWYEGNWMLREAIRMISEGVFSGGDRHLFRPLIDSLMDVDYYLLFADYQSYIDCQHEVDRKFRDQPLWTKMSILNTARMGYFSSDRSIQQYCDEIWKIDPVHVELLPERTIEPFV